MEFKIITKKEFDRVLNISGEWSLKMSLFSEMVRFNTLVEVKAAGSGHLGSSLSSIDIITYLYLNELNVLETGLSSPDRDIYFSSKGHDVPGLYSLFYALGILPEEKLLKLRKLHGLDGHPEVRIPGIEANTGSLGMGISKGKGMAWAKRNKNHEGRIFVLTGDGEFQEGQIYESLQAAAHQKANNMIVIMDHNKYQTDRLVDDVNRIEDVPDKVSSFGWHVERVNGHDFNALKKIINKFKGITDKPKFIIAETIKGRGISFMEQPETESASGRTYYKWHSGAPDNDSFMLGLFELTKRIEELSAELKIAPIQIPNNKKPERVSAKINQEFVTDAYGEALVELAETNTNFIVLDGDLSADCKLRPFEIKFPERFIENGIAEQDMVSMAGGMARMGILPIVNTFASFLSARANEQIYNNACEETKIIYTFHFAGIIPAGPGKSHQSVRDISLMGALPNITILQPCNSIETKMVLNYCINEAEENCVIRLVIGPSPEKIILPEDYRLEFGKGAKLTGGGDAVLFAYGPVMLHEALLAAKYLRHENFGITVVNMPWLNKIDAGWLRKTIDGLEKIFILEDHSVTGGLGDRILNALNENNLMGNVNIKIFGLDRYPECGTPGEVLKYHGLDGYSLAQKILDRDLMANEEANKDYSDHAPQ